MTCSLSDLKKLIIWEISVYSKKSLKIPLMLYQNITSFTVFFKDFAFLLKTNSEWLQNNIETVNGRFQFKLSQSKFLLNFCQKIFIVFIIKSIVLLWGQL